MEVTLKEVDDLITKAGEAFSAKAANAEKLAKEAEEKAEILLKKMDGMVSKEDAAKLEKQLQDLDLMIQKQNVNQVAKSETFEDAFMKAYEPVLNEIIKMRDSNERLKAPLTFEIGQKTVGVISLASTIANAASVGQVTISEFTGLVSPIRQRLLSYLGAVSSGPAGGQYVQWVEEYDQEGAPIMIGEGVTKTQIDVHYKEMRAKVNKIGVTMKVTMEMLEDAGYLLSYIQSNGVKRVETVIENQLFNGSGTDPQLIGLISKSTAFSGGTMANTVATATNWDVINGIINQSKAANGLVSGIFVANGELHSMLSAKGTDGHYVLPAGVTFNAQGGVSAWGVPLIGTNALGGTDVDFIGGDLSVIHVLLRSGIQVSIGESGEDFRDNLKTIRIEQRLVQYVSANDIPVLIKGTFAAAKVALDPAVT